MALAEEEQDIVETKSIVAEKKQDKRGINSIGYAYGSSGLGYDGLGLSNDYTNGGYNIAPARVNYINGGGLGTTLLMYILKYFVPTFILFLTFN